MRFGLCFTNVQQVLVSGHVARLALYGNAIGDAGAVALANALRYQASWRCNCRFGKLQLDFQNVSFFCGQGFCVHNRSSLSTFIVCVCFSGCPLLIIPFVVDRWYGHIYRHNTSLQQLHLAHNTIGDAGAAAIGEGLWCANLHLCMYACAC